MAKEQYYGTGRRKSSVARVRLFPGGTGEITIKDTKINSWAMNNSGVGFAIRGDYPATGRTLTIQNVYFGLDEQSGNSDFGHVKVGSFSGNTDGTETAGTYSK